MATNGARDGRLADGTMHWLLPCGAPIMPLRDYQHQAVVDLRESVVAHGSTVFVCPTGSGKSLVAGELARLASLKGKRSLFLVHRRELVKQLLGTISEFCPGLSIGVEAAGWPSMPWANLQIASVQSLYRRTHDLKPDLVVVDEAHHARAATWAAVLTRWPNAARVGLTATPQRADGRGLGELFASLVLGPSIPELVEAGYLAPSRTLTIPTSLNMEGVRVDRNGEYRSGDVSERVTDKFVADGVDAYRRYASGKRAIFFGIHRDHSKKVCAGLQAVGVRAAHVDGTDSTARRDRIMNELRTGGLDCVGNVQLIDEGFDAPGCDCVLLGAPTTSVTRYLQQCGRAMRPGPDKTALILDLAGNAHELGLPDEVREWTLDDGEVNEDKAKKKHPRVCIKCYTAFYGRMCPNCFYSEPLGEVPETVTELVEAQRVPKPTPTRRKQLNYELAMAWQADDPKSAVREVGRQHGYKSGWAEHILRIKGMV